jgi:hypothetical protein
MSLSCGVNLREEMGGCFEPVRFHLYITVEGENLQTIFQDPEVRKLTINDFNDIYGTVMQLYFYSPEEGHKLWILLRQKYPHVNVSKILMNSY